jgi:hypothetical protein
MLSFPQGRTTLDSARVRARTRARHPVWRLALHDSMGAGLETGATSGTRRLALQTTFATHDNGPAVCVRRFRSDAAGESQEGAGRELEGGGRG